MRRGESGASTNDRCRQGCRLSYHSIEEQTSATLLEQRVSYGMVLGRLLCKARFTKKPEGGQSGAGETGEFHLRSELEITFWHVTTVTTPKLQICICLVSPQPCAVRASRRELPLEIPSIRTLNPFSPLPQSIVSERKCVNCEQPIVFMSSTGQATSASYFQLIIDATADYTKITGIDLLKSPLAATLEQSSTLDTILQLLQGREKALKESLDSNRRLFNYLSPVVKVLHAFSRIIDEPVSVVSHMLQYLVRFLT
jgi:hypothetical protein